MELNHKEDDDAQTKLNSIEMVKNLFLSRTKHRPKILIICGTGLGQLADQLEQPDIIPYSEIPNYAVSTVPGHVGRLVFGLLSDTCIVCMQGRLHAYEGHSMWRITFLVRVMAAMGVQVLIATNAAGGINRALKEGDFVVIKDHINLPGLSGLNPLVGLNDLRFGARFQELTSTYDHDLRQKAKTTAKKLGMEFVREGVYCYQVGPTFETPAELKFMQTCGADLAGMSTVPEAIVARHCGLKVLGMSLVTNEAVLDVDCKKSPNHEEVLEVGKLRSADLMRFFKEIVKHIV